MVGSFERGWDETLSHARFFHHPLFFSGPSCCITKQDVHVEFLLVGSEGTVGLKGAIGDI